MASGILATGERRCALRGLHCWHLAALYYVCVTMYIQNAVYRTPWQRRVLFHSYFYHNTKLFVSGRLWVSYNLSVQLMPVSTALSFKFMSIEQINRSAGLPWVCRPVRRHSRPWDLVSSSHARRPVRRRHLNQPAGIRWCWLLRTGNCRCRVRWSTENDPRRPAS